MKTIVTLTAASLAAASFLVFADPGSHGGRGGMERLKAADTNGDGMISREEAKAFPRLSQHFDQIDTDKNGLISPEEMKAAHQARKNAAFDKLDTNKDGVLSRDEFNTAHAHRAAK